MSEPVNWRDLIPPDWEGSCVVCSGRLTTADFARENVVAAVGPEGTVACHAHHVSNPAEYDKAVRLMAEAKVKQIKAEQANEKE